MERFEGLFTLYKTNDTVYALVKGSVFDQPLLAPITIARGMAMAGEPLNFGDEWILVFHRDGDKVQLLRRNIHYKAPPGTPLEKAVQQNYIDSVLMALPIVSVSGGDALIDFSQIFLTDFANLRLGALDRNRTTWSKIKTFPNNIELEVEATFTHGLGLYGMRGFGDDGVADDRGLTLIIHYGLDRLPGPGYRPRFADHRIGHFISAVRDFGSPDPETTFDRMINRWRLEKADPRAKISPPKKQLVWWVEDTVPEEFRPYVQEGILEWNKAFEKIGFRDAIAVRWQNERDDFDPDDINYSTFRWITTSSTFAMSGLRANPLTGEMIDGDVIFDASWIRYWKMEYAFLVGKPVPAAEAALTPLARAEIISPIMADKYGYGLPFPLPGHQLSMLLQGKDQREYALDLVPAQWGPLQLELHRRLNSGQINACNYAQSKQQELCLAAIALAESGKAESDTNLPEEFLGQAIKEVVMHEIGHSLGLRHNFKGSTMLRNDQINDPSITRVKGMSGSVMDYNPINIASKGQKQGDYTTTTLGPYDYWAIEYAYKPIAGDEKVELEKIAARSPEHDLAYGTDEDMFTDDDPDINTYDLGSDPLKYGEDRLALATGLLKNLDEKVIPNGESWSRLRSAFSLLLNQYGNAAYLASEFIGGQSVSRDFKEKGGHDPIVPIAGDKQREALHFLVTKILSDKTFQFSPRLLRRLTTDLWYHWGSEETLFGGSVDYPIINRVFAIQRIALNRCFDPAVLSRLENQELEANPDSNPLDLAELFQGLTDGIWSELKPEESGGERTLAISTIRRNLQREHLRRLSSILLGNRRNPLQDLYGFIMVLGNTGTYPEDAKSLARTQLIDIQKSIQRTLHDSDLKLDKVTESHLSECQQRISKVLSASYRVSEP